MQDSYVKIDKGSDGLVPLNILEATAGCVTGSLELVTTCSADTRKHGIYSIFDFSPAQCGDDVEVAVTLLQGNSVLLMEACSELYPSAVPSQSFADTIGPRVLVDGQPCADVVVSGCVAQVVTFTLAASDACDPNPTITSQTHHSGEVFQPGATPVTVTTQDSAGNTGSCTFNVVVRTDFAIVTSTTTPVSCVEASDGAIDISVGGGVGVAPFTFLWENGATTEDVSGLPAGTYTVAVQDSQGCGDAHTATIGFSSSDDLTPPSITCPADVSSCSVPSPDVDAVVASDSCGPVTVVHVGDTATSGSGCPGDEASVTRTYKATDTSGNEASCTQVLTQSSQLVKANFSANTVVEKGECAELTATYISGGCAGDEPSYLWSTGETTSSIQACPEHCTNYTVTVNAGQCSNTAAEGKINVQVPMDHFRHCVHGVLVQSGTLTGRKCRCPGNCPVCTHYYRTVGRDLHSVVGKECRACPPEAKYYFEDKCHQR